MTKASLLRLVMLFMSLCNSRSILAWQVESSQLSVGVLSQMAPPAHGYIFRSDSGVTEVYDMSLKATKMNYHGELGPPDIREIGFRLDNGAEYLYSTSAGVRNEVATALLAEMEYPGHKRVITLFEGRYGHILEMPASNSVRVLRADVTISGSTFTLWSNVTDHENGKLDGVSISLRARDPSTIVCSLSNSSSVQLSMISNESPFAAEITLYDERGNSIPINAKWETTEAARVPPGAGTIGPNERRSFEIPLEEAFGPRWREGDSLRVTLPVLPDPISKSRTRRQYITAYIKLHGEPPGR